MPKYWKYNPALKKFEGLVNGIWSTINPITGVEWVDQQEYIDAELDTFYAEAQQRSLDAKVYARKYNIHKDGHVLSLIPNIQDCESIRVIRNGIAKVLPVPQPVEIPQGLSLMLYDENGLTFSQESYTGYACIGVACRTGDDSQIFARETFVVDVPTTYHRFIVNPSTTPILPSVDGKIFCAITTTGAAVVDVNLGGEKIGIIPTNSPSLLIWEITIMSATIDGEYELTVTPNTINQDHTVILEMV